MSLHHRHIKRPDDMEAVKPEIVDSARRADDAYASLQRQRSWVESAVRTLTTRNQLNNFGDEVTLSFTPRRSPDVPGSPRPLRG